MPSPACQQVTKGNNSIKYTPGHGPAVPQECPETGAGFLMGGPFWAEPIHDMDWVAGLLDLVRSQKDRCVAECGHTSGIIN